MTPDLLTTPLPPIVAISGKQQSGKDTLGQMLRERIPGAIRLAFADALKAELATACGVSVEAIEANKEWYRGGMQWWGEWRRWQDPEYWIQRLVASAGRPENRGAPLLVVTDLRYMNEYDWVTARGGYRVRIHRTANHPDTHHSETDLDRHYFDFRIDNAGTRDALASEADRLVTVLGWRFPLTPSVEHCITLP